MKNHWSMARLPLALAAATVLLGCAAAHRPPTSPPAAAPGAATAPPTAPSAPPSKEARRALLAVCDAAREKPSPRTDPHEDLDSILWQQTAAEYRAATLTVYRAAQGALFGLVAAAKKTEPGKRPVVVLDLDETVLDNSRFQGRLLLERRNYESPLWDCWVGQKQALRIAGVEILFREMVRQGVRGRYVTNRKCRPRPGKGEPCPQKRETLENLNAVLEGTGYVASPDELLLAGESNPRTGEVWDEEKKPRRDFIAETHAIVMLVGDDLGDFLPDVRRSTIAARAEGTARAGDRWGASWFLLPNASYGSWAAAVDAAVPPGGTRAGVVEAFPYPKD